MCFLLLHMYVRDSSCTEGMDEPSVDIMLITAIDEVNTHTQMSSDC